MSRKGTKVWKVLKSKDKQKKSTASKQKKHNVWINMDIPREVRGANASGQHNCRGVCVHCCISPPPPPPSKGHRPSESYAKPSEASGGPFQHTSIFFMKRTSFWRSYAITFTLQKALSGGSSILHFWPWLAQKLGSPQRIHSIIESSWFIHLLFFVPLKCGLSIIIKASRISVLFWKGE